MQKQNWDFKLRQWIADHERRTIDWEREAHRPMTGVERLAWEVDGRLLRAEIDTMAFAVRCMVQSLVASAATAA